MPHNRPEMERAIRRRFEFVVFGNEYNAVHGILAVIDGIATGGTFTIEFLQNELSQLGIDVATAMINAGVDPTREPIYVDIMTFNNWEQPIPGVKIPLPNKFVPYVAARKKTGGAVSSGPSFSTPLLQTGTSMHQTDGYFDFKMSHWGDGGKPDLFTIKKRETGTHSTEVHVLSGESNFQDFVLQTGTGLHETDNNWDFDVVDWNGDGRPDLVGIKKQGANSTEVHILGGANNYADFILQTGTALNKTNDSWKFFMVNWDGGSKPDLAAVCTRHTGSGSTEVHILSGESNYSSFILHTGTALPETSGEFEFVMADWNNDGKPDLVAIKKNGTGTNKTEVHVLSGASNFQNFILHVPTWLHETDESFDFDLHQWDTGKLDLFAIKKLGTGTRSTEMHIFRG